VAYGPSVVRHDEAETFWFFGTLSFFLAPSEQTGGEFCLFEQYARQGNATPLHRQPKDQETFHVLEGDVKFYLGEGEPITVTVGTTVHVPAGAVHAFEVVSPTARWLNVTTPNHERFFRAAAEPARTREIPPAGPPDMEKVMAAAAQYGVEILGPPPGAAHDAH
jgi:quercetin dioxygenase-like cupin family protein